MKSGSVSARAAIRVGVIRGLILHGLPAMLVSFGQELGRSASR